MGNPYGRSTIVPLTNKSGGSVAAGDLVYIDTANNDAFTTGTTSGYTKGIGIAQQTIASNAIGLVLIDGYAALVNVNASVTRGNFLKGYTVVKQGTDAGSSRAAGTCGMFLTGGTTPDAIIWQPDLGAGSGLTDPMTTRGDIIVRDSANTTNRLAIGATAGMVVGRTGSDVAYFLPPGYEYDYVAKTTSTNITATVEGSADTIVTGSAVTYDGSTAVVIEFRAAYAQQPAADTNLSIWLYDGGSSIGRMTIVTNPASSGYSGNFRVPILLAVRITPSAAAHTYSVRGTVSGGTGVVAAGAGGNGVDYPAFIRIVKV